MARIGVITPSNSERWIAAAWTSLCRQSFPDWQWVVVANGALQPAMCSAITRQDPRVKIVEADSHTHARIGALKHLGGMSIDADFTVEFDHDDELSTDCLAEVATAFETGADFVYSRTGIAANEKGFCLLDPRNGWRHERLPFHGSTSESLISPLNPPLYPQNLCRMALAPNHVRAWRTSAYRSLGGHSKELSVCD